MFDLANETTQLYKLVKPLPLDLHGWFGNRRQLKEVFRSCDIETVIELGSWAGQSTVFFAEEVGFNGKVYAIDTWLGSPQENEHKDDPRIQHLFQLFLSNVKHKGLEEVILPIRMSTNEAAKALDIRADLIYVDGDHSYEQVRADILNWQNHLFPRGVLCGDDWGWESVRKAVEDCAPLLGKEIEADGNFWRYR